MTILDKIIATKEKEVKERRELYPAKLLEQSIHFGAPRVSMVEYLAREDKVGIIAEIKRRSPSKGEFHKKISVEELSIGYMQAGASALSVLTDREYFGGSNVDLEIARKFNFCPILRKDFVIDEYQVIEAKAIGADVILLIAAALTPERVQELTKLAQSLGLEVLLEVHDSDEITAHPCDQVDLVGVNNRDLKTFDVSVETSLKLIEELPKELPKISESGIDSAETIAKLRSAGFSGFLIGEAFMKDGRPQRACRRLVKRIRKLEASQ